MEGKEGASPVPSVLDVSSFFDALARGPTNVKCVCNIADTVVVREGIPVRWLFTSAKTGEILRKRSMEDKFFLLESFLRASLADPANVEGFVATLWPTNGGPPRLLNRPEFEEFVKNMSTSLSGVAAMQCYLHPRGGDGTLYVNEYSVAGESQRVTTNTMKHLRQLTRAPAELDRETVLRSREAKLSDRLDSMTLTLIRYIEATLRVHITKAVVEYVIDTSGTPYVVRAHNIHTVPRAAPAPPSKAAADSQLAKVGKCRGDYCNRWNDFSVPASRRVLDIAQNFFSADDLEVLGDRLEAQAMPRIASAPAAGGETDPAPYKMMFKSVLLAREDERRMKELRGELDDAGGIPSEGHMRATAAKASRDGDGGVGAGTYYKEISLCPACYGIYTMLDRARATIRESAEKASKTGALTKDAPRSRRISASKDRVADGERKDKAADGERRAPDRAPRKSDIITVPKPAVEASPAPLKKAPLSHGAPQPKPTVEVDLPKKGLSSSVSLPTLHQKTTEKVALPARRRAFESSPMDKPQSTGSPPSKTAVGNKLRSVSPPPVPEYPFSIPQEKSEAVDDGSNTARSAASEGDGWRGRVLLADSDKKSVNVARQHLVSAGFSVRVVTQGPKVLGITRTAKYDALLVARELPALGGLEVARVIRQREEGMKLASMSSVPVKRLPIIAFTNRTTPDDLRAYMDVGMDGCVSKPVDSIALLNTLAAAVPDAPGSPPRASPLPKVSAATAVRVSPVVGPRAVPSEGERQGVCSPGPGVSFPYLVLGEAKPKAPVFHILVVNDFFDTFERHQIFFRPLTDKYPGLQVLLFNLPGQANTSWPKDAVLNNEFYAACIKALLTQVGYRGSAQFLGASPSTPFYILGSGNGGNIASCFSMRYSHDFPGLRAVVLVNSFLHVDTQLAGILHDSINVFSCSPPTRLDLPVYFFSRFLFSPAYIAQVGAPLALNIYTAVSNPISNEGRVAICRGALGHSDLRTTLDALVVPAILVTGTEDGLINPAHTRALLAVRGSLDKPESIKSVLSAPRARATVAWLHSGHESFQECKKALSSMLEQLVTGFHDHGDAAVGASPVRHVGGLMNSTSSVSAMTPAVQAVFRPTVAYKPAEDRFIDNTLAAAPSRKMDIGKSISLPPASTASAVPAVLEPEVKEYMQWRVRRNKKRLARLEGSVIMIQRAYRAYIARTLAWRAKNHRFALRIQMWWRRMMAVAILRQKKREDWAARVVQRHWRGFSARDYVYQMFLRRKAAVTIQRVWRGFLGKKWVDMLRRARHVACIKIQSCYRSHLARLAALRMRDQRIAATNIQRVYRGRIGRLRAKRERERFLFSRSQSQGIEFGRQMLTEHRLHGTRLQSEVLLLTREKSEAEARLEAVLEEIAVFESGVRSLEIEMAQLTRAETDAAGTLDEAAKLDLRENKLRLDREFSSMLIKIADRRETLQALEKQLQSIDRARRAKKEELRDLERKLVVLLEEQQAELAAIKKRQEKANTRVIPDIVGETKRELSSRSGSRGASRRRSVTSREDANNSQGEESEGRSNGYGPTPQQRAEANALMSSTETMMKFGFMSMSMTYFSSLNMIRAMKQVGAANTLLSNPLLAGGGTAAPAAVPSSSSSGSPSRAPLAVTTGAVTNVSTGGYTPDPRTVTLWNVADVAQWLDSLSLGQYKHVFAEAAVDGAFLYDLSDEDLRNTLGIEHNLHRKKILVAIHRLKSQVGVPGTSKAGSIVPGMASGPGGSLALPPAAVGDSMMSGSVYSMDSWNTPAAASKPAPDALPASLRLEEMFSWVRHNKLKKLTAALGPMPDRSFDQSVVIAQYLDGFGTQYDEAHLRGLAFNINGTDDYGNTLLIAACQNGHQAIAAVLIKKGANPNHQNKLGNTALHFAMEYNFYDLGSWLADPTKGGASDDTLNKFGLGPYDGIGPSR